MDLKLCIFLRRFKICKLNTRIEHTPAELLILIMTLMKNVGCVRFGDADGYRGEI